MKKRDRGLPTSGEGPSKRRKGDVAGSSSDVDMVPGEEFIEEEQEEEEENLQEIAMKLWQTVKDAVKDGRSLSLQFLKQPNPRIWPDYYKLIQNPIALDDIKKRIKSGQYSDLEAVRQDFELCFNNAKQYNLPDSDIYNDAKDLLKLTNKAYRKLMPSEPGDKPPSMKRLLSSRLQKLTKKSDDSGRILSTMFLELPSKKIWPDYYKLINNPRCLDTIQRQVKRKEYQFSADFAADVELVFANAMKYNVEHTQIWEDALTLRDYFRQLMADLPPPYALPQYTQPPKIKIKMPVAHPKVEEEAQPLPTISLRVPALAKAVTSNPPEVKAPPPKSHSTPKPGLPPAPATAVAPVPTSAPAPPSPPKQPTSKPAAAHLPPQLAIAQPSPKPAIVHPTPKPAIAHPTPKPSVAHSSPKLSVAHPSPKLPAAPTAPRRQTKTRTPQPQTILQLHPTTAPSYTGVTFAKPSPLSYVLPTASPIPQLVVPVPSFVSAPPQQLAPSPAPAFATTPTPPPVIPPSHQLRFVLLRSEPRGRVLRLDHRDGVTSWAMRLEQDEKSLSVREIVFMTEPGESSEEEDEGEGEDVNMDGAESEHPVKKRGRGRPPKVSKAQAVKAAPSKKKKIKKRGETQVMVNGTLVNEDEEHGGNWPVELATGYNVLEVGEKGGLIWKVYAERVASS